MKRIDACPVSDKQNASYRVHASINDDARGAGGLRGTSAAVLLNGVFFLPNDCRTRRRNIGETDDALPADTAFGPFQLRFEFPSVSSDCSMLPPQPSRLRYFRVPYPKNCQRGSILKSVPFVHPSVINRNR
ncbi:hypothetical protein EVAR_17128_1 [Eumeta japonica]|uniref:Uncharacterized protein n=1 Tax=Eumeta variegata TaxID=151549 RepID=A0A4C1UN61_EUMVA|nr:hypothetical protein EVAR_17128_1 [Eumeta japonica]